MSSEALAWAFKVNVKPSALKFTLVALCECANYKTGHIYPSIAHLEEITGQDRKTLIANIAKLELLGLIVDTGERAGKTGQIKVYRATMKGAQIERQDSHYVYKLIDSDGRYYIGVRSCVCSPEDDSYMGSGVWPRTCAANGIELTKTIVSTHANRSDAEVAEALMIKAAIGDHSCMNIEYKNTEKGIPKTELFNSNSPVFPPKQSQKRDTEPSREPSVVKANALPTKRARTLAKKPDCVSDNVWRDWLAHRKTAFTDTALEGFKREAAKAGWSLEAAIRESIERSWQGFKADWVREKSNGQHHSNQSGGRTVNAAASVIARLGGTGMETGTGSGAPGGYANGDPAVDALPSALLAIGYDAGRP